jgi:hypothetical protein
MTYTLGRRRLLTRAALGSTATLVGATAFGSLAPEEVHAAAAQSVEPGESDPNFVEGRVTGRDGSLLRVTGSEGAMHRIRLTDGTSVWKLRPTTMDRIDVGDGLYARGIRLKGDELVAEAIWVNIVNLTVHIDSISANTVYADHHGNKIVLRVVPGTSAAVYNNTPAVSDLSMIKVGAHAQIVGAWHPDTDEVDIATIYAAA